MSDASMTEPKTGQIDTIDAELDEESVSTSIAPHTAALRWKVGAGSASQRVKFSTPPSVVLDKKTTHIHLSVRHGNVDENPNHTDSFAFRIDKIEGNGRTFYAYMRRLDSRSGYTSPVMVDAWLLKTRS